MGENDRFFLTSFQADLQIVELVVVCGTIVHEVKALCCQKMQLSMSLEQAARVGIGLLRRSLTIRWTESIALQPFSSFVKHSLHTFFFLINEIKLVSTGLPRES